MLAFGEEKKRWAEPQYLAQPSLGVRPEAQGYGVPLMIVMPPRWGHMLRPLVARAPGRVRAPADKAAVLAPRPYKPPGGRGGAQAGCREESQ
jgi:hypothetical protein